MPERERTSYYESEQTELGLLFFIRNLYPQTSLITQLVGGELRSRYRRSFLGLLWTLINPIISSLVLWMVFVSVFKSSLKNGTQYAPYLLAGVLLLTFFTQGLMQAADSISNGRGIFMKIRVDARLFCLSKVLSNLVNFFIGIIALVLITIFSGGSITPRLPLVLLVGFSLSVFTFGLSLIFSILFIRFDDVKYITTFLLQLLTYLTPVFYPKEILSPNLRFFIAVNPLSSFLDVFRNVVNGTEIATIFDWAYMFTSSVLAFLIGIFVFQKSWVKTVVMM